MKYNKYTFVLQELSSENCLYDDKALRRTRKTEGYIPSAVWKYNVNYS